MWMHFLPAILLVPLALWGGLIKKCCAFHLPPQPYWPFAEQPGLALELAGSLPFVYRILGDKDSEAGQQNIRTAIRFQKLDFTFIALYTLFFAVTALQIGGWPRALPAIAFVLLAAISDVFEDLRILGMVEHAFTKPAKPFGQVKWFFYFATLAAEGWLWLPGANIGPRTLTAWALAILLIGTAAGGIFSSIKASFSGIASAMKLSMLGIVGLAVAPLVAIAPFSWRLVAEYVILMRVPLLVAMILFTLPIVAFLTPAKSLLRGLFDVTPWSMLVVTLASLAVAGAACSAASLVLMNAYLRFRVDGPWKSLPSIPVWLTIALILALPVIVSTGVFSARQNGRTAHLIAAALAGIVVGGVLAAYLAYSGADLVAAILPSERLQHWMAATGLFNGYLPVPGVADPWPSHLGALAAFFGTLLVYAGVGMYGRWSLGRERTVPALGSALMALLMLNWMLSSVAFFFDAWRIPILLIILLAGTLTAQSEKSDHLYSLRKRQDSSLEPDPVCVITATDEPCVIVVAANGGGIQAGAWVAQVLAGLCEDCGPRFVRALRMISSVSGGSVGTACFLHALANPDDARPPAEAAAKSSLDEVAWGLAWPDLLRALFPWVFGRLIGRGRALEKAWLLNAVQSLTQTGALDRPLSNWNAEAGRGDLPSVIMNATIAETGERLLLATTRLGPPKSRGEARVDARELHTINGEELDVGVATAARLSASFPYVTPASRADSSGRQPHIVDGGYYDNYGMATLVEWLDEALKGAAGRVKKVLVLQVHGAPVNTGTPAQRHAKSRGWFYQAIAPLTTLAAVRSTGQVAHNDLELRLLQQQWQTAGIDIDTITFEFRNPNAPLSWHLTRQEIDDIRIAWRDDMSDCRQAVRNFLDSCS